jgi:Ca-activated chloride channel family protein
VAAALDIVAGGRVGAEGLVMMRGLLLLLLLALISQAQAFELWDKMWRNADQRGDALLQRGDAAKATQIYRDAKRKAYAKLAAGDYQGAAKDLESMHDSDADYNRGNALAHAGDLQGALDAYDAALHSNPQNMDAKHNREIVANALKQQPPQQQKKSDSNQSQDGKKSGEQGKDNGSGKQGKPGEQGKQGEQNKQGEQDKNAAADKSAQGAGPAAQQNPDAQKQNSAAQNKQQDQASKAPESKGQDSKTQSAKQDAAKSAAVAQGDKAAAQGQDKDAAEQARRDAEASLGKQAADGKKGAVAGEEKYAAPPAAKSEQQIAQEQWLRSIPDDPGGLLRRKFMIEHMMRQQKVQQ